MPQKRCRWTAEAFLAALDRSGGEDACWPVPAIIRRDSFGYGRIWLGRRFERTHRIAWKNSRGPIPGRLCVLHKCDNPPCCNPKHLFLGTRADNNADKIAKGRQARGEPMNAHRGKVTAEQVREIRASYAAGGVTMRALCERYGLGLTSMQHLLVRKNWAWVE